MHYFVFFSHSRLKCSLGSRQLKYERVHCEKKAAEWGERGFILGIGGSRGFKQDCQLNKELCQLKALLWNAVQCFGVYWWLYT